MSLGLSTSSPSAGMCYMVLNRSGQRPRRFTLPSQKMCWKVREDQKGSGPFTLFCSCPVCMYIRKAPSSDREIPPRGTCGYPDHLPFVMICLGSVRRRNIENPPCHSLVHSRSKGSRIVLRSFRNRKILQCSMTCFKLGSRSR